MRRWLIAALAAVAIVAAGPITHVVSSSSGAAMDRGWTALRFQDPTAAAEGLVASTGATVQFAIENHSDHATSYVWTARLVVGGSSMLLARRDVSVGANATAVLALPITPTSAVPGSRLSISLDGGEQIDLGVNDPAEVS